MRIIPTWWREAQWWLCGRGLPAWLVQPIGSVLDWWDWRGWKPGVIFESCSLHPCELTRINVDQDDIEGRSLLDGSIQSCSLRHCGVLLLDPDEVTERIAAWAAEGERGLLKIYYGSDEAADAFLKEWR